ncbi:neuronal calcium sensor 2-like [Watersipora subatra]|uniref:neuronal calcium sensor 2-like n=1 Tax=Watersipora subatra TaxID=2589382 RepID=UPI00355C7C28
MGGSSSTQVPKEDLAFLLANTSFSKPQIKQWYKGFMRDCPAGQLSRQKFLEVYSEFFPGGNAEEFCEHVFRTFDADNGGTIDFKEFLLAINITSSGQITDKLNWAFSMYDIDGNGTIEKAEMVQIIAAIYRMVSNGKDTPAETAEQRTERIFIQMDKNKDGVLTKQEFINGCLSDDVLCSMLTASAASK